MDRTRIDIDLLILLLLALVMSGGGVIGERATAAVYIYEKDTTAIPLPVEAALNKLNRERKILATIFEQDTVDGSGETPEQYKVPLAAAKEAGLPALVVTADKKVLKVIKDPKTEEQVLGAAL